MPIDLNCDMGEGYGAYTIGADEALMPLITSANIACGFHAGDPIVLDRTVALAKEHGVAVGAHPGFPDLAGFGRRNMQLSAAEIENMVLYQLGAINAFCRAHNVPLVHCKAHGALYNMAVNDAPLSNAIARGIARFDRGLVMVGLATSKVMAAAAQSAGLAFAREAFADRVYNPDGTLQSRAIPGSLITEPARVAAQAVQIARGYVTAHDGKVIELNAETLCLHGDNPAARQNAQAVRNGLRDAGIEVKQISRDDK